MKHYSFRIMILVLTGVLFLSVSSVFAETIVLKSGKKIEGKIIEKTDKYIKIDYLGIPTTFFLDEIENIKEERALTEASPVGVGIGLSNANFDESLKKAGTNDTFDPHKEIISGTKISNSLAESMAGSHSSNLNIEGVGESKVCVKLGKEVLSATSHSFGYAFSISPDENWIVIPAGYPKSGINLFYIPSGQKWNYLFNDDPRTFVNWFPNCFSEDSLKIYFGDFFAALNPSMSSIEFQKLEKPLNMENFKGTFLSFKGARKNCTGVDIQSWLSISGDEGEFGEVACNSGEDELIETSSGNGKVYLVISSNKSGTKLKKEVDLTELVKNYQTESRSVMENAMQKLSTEISDKSQLDSIKGVLKELGQNSSNLAIGLDHLSVSPDNRFIACIASGDGYGLGGIDNYGILIPLEGDKLIAYPFSRNVYYKIIWSKDSRRIYYCAKSVGGDPIEGSAIYRLDISI